jgi:Zn-dependent peptidase ImmA (M78 family)
MPDTTAAKRNNSSLLERGFKSWCENTSATIRKKLGLEAYAPLSWQQVADYLGVEVRKLDSLPNLGQESINYLSSPAGDEWSAVTVASPDKIIIVANPQHSIGRCSNSIMHELAHILLEHSGSRVFIAEDGFALRDYNDKQEEEADWLAGSLLLPRTALQHLYYRRVPRETILEDYCVSSDLYSFRIRMTAINRQFRR